MNLKDLIFPKICVKCGRCGVFVCDRCFGKVHLCKQICIECGKPAVDGKTHTKCQKKFGIDACICAWSYEGVVRKAILSLKYKFAYEIGDELAIRYLKFLNDLNFLFPRKVLLIPIPAHRLRKNWRGFNQSEQIGKLIAQKMDWDYANLLCRIIQRPPQTGLEAEKRVKNVVGVFSLNKQSQVTLDKYRVVVIFDDVITTGTTIKEAVKIIKKGGAEQVWGIALAR